MTDYFDLGAYSHRVSTHSEQAQIWFDRGLVWCYGFNHEEAIRCFEQLLTQDPQCAMGHWGIALSHADINIDSSCCCRKNTFEIN